MYVLRSSVTVRRIFIGVEDIVAGYKRLPDNQTRLIVAAKAAIGALTNPKDGTSLSTLSDCTSYRTL
jgi:hypothetical protein